MFYRALFCYALLSALLVVPAIGQSDAPLDPAPQEDTVVGPGHTAHWYDPQRAGEGWVLEIVDEATAVVYWFTFDEAGNPRWLLGVGEIVSEDGDEWIEFPELLVTSDGVFGSEFDPDEVVTKVVGEAAMAFTGCDRGVVSYQAFDQQQTLELTRLSRTMAADCTEPIHGRPLMQISDDAGLTGSWYDPARSGEGFSLHWLDRDEALITWYTYDTEGNQQWMIGTGRRQGDQVVFPELVTARGARFGEAFDANEVELEPWGELVLELECDVGAAGWTALEERFGEGTLDLSRLTALDKPGCPLTRPELTDLYDFELSEIPVSPSSNHRATAMALDGTVVGYRPNAGKNRVWRWRPGEPTVEEVPGITRFDFALVAPDGDYMVTNRRDPPDGDVSSPTVPHLWSESEGWQALSQLTLNTSHVRDMSHDGSHLVGRGRSASEGDSLTAAWIWDAENGQRALPLAPSEGTITGTGLGVSNDGRVAVGVQTDNLGPPSFPRRDLATRWVDEGEPEYLRDQWGAILGWAFGCDALCDIIIGGDQGAEIPPDHPHRDEAWIWTEDDGAEYLGELPDATSWPYFADQASADASLIAGTYQIENADGSSGTRGFVWTRATGLVALADVLEELGISDSTWYGTRVADVSPDGRRLLVRGLRLGSFDDWAGIVHLEPVRRPHE